MTNILHKPYSDTEYADFAVMANTNGQTIEQDDNAAYALYIYEELQNCQIIDISSTPEYQAKQQKQIQEQNNQNILSQISALEAKANRSLRDAILRGDNTYLNQYDSQIEALRSQLKL